MIFTSYFAKMGKLGKSYQYYSIAYKKPPFFVGNHLDIVAPNKNLVIDYKNNKITEEEYTKIYIDYLNSNKKEIIEGIQQLPNNSVLLCYEKPGKFCHRHVLANWLKEQDIEITEI